MRALLQHIAQNGDLQGRVCTGQDIQPGFHGRGIGVIGIVIEDHPAGKSVNVHPHGRRHIGSQSCPDLLFRHTEIQGDRRRGHDRIQHMMSGSRYFQVKAAFRCDCPQTCHACPAAIHIFRPVITGRGFPDPADLEGRFSPQSRQQVIVSVQDRDPAFPQAVEYLAFSLENAFPAAQIAYVGITDIGDDSNVRFPDPGQIINLVFVVHAHFQNRDLMFRAQPENGHGKSYIIIEIALCLQYIEPGAQDRGDHILGGRLAHAAGDRYCRDLKFSLIITGQIAHGPDRIRDQYVIFAGQQLPGLSGNHAAVRAALQSAVQKIMGVKPLSDQGKKDISFFRLSAVGFHMPHRHGGIALQESAACGFYQFLYQ